MSKLPEGKLRDRAESAKSRSSEFGPDIDLNAFSCDAEAHKKIPKLDDLPDEIKSRAASAGMNMAEERRAGSFFQTDHSPVFSSSYQNGIEVMNITEALEKYDWLSEYSWNTLHVDADKYTAAAELREHQGYFLRALPGVKCDVPVQACLYMSRNHLAQHVHNIIIAEPGSELNIITGCAVGRHVNNGLHIGASEFYVKKDARITFTMIHNWAEDISVRPRSTVVVEENGVFMNNYICMKPVRTLQMYPTTYCVGENATARYYNILLAHEGSAFDIGSRVFLQAPGSRAEIITRAITEGGSIIARGHLVGEVQGIKAHLECRGLILSEHGTIHAIPELEAKTNDLDMSHEAAIGKIAAEEIQYLMARGLSSEEATSIIIRGFLDIKIRELPESLEKEIKNATRFKAKHDRLL
jgi:hypothetical protein